ncbi:MAG: vitamin K epoxide reductase family protein [Micromonosporaceae bacterium]|nr:vitamin K epoxide reductase family protein [Micromonosporaceae bacterium]
MSIYLTVEHYTAPGSLACPVGGGVDCARVTTSTQSEFVHIPVAVLGIVFFAAMLALCLPMLWRWPDRRLWQARIAVAGLGVLFVIYLIFAELFIIEAFCLWCTAVHLVAFGLFAVVVLASAMADPSPFDPR